GPRPRRRHRAGRALDRRPPPARRGPRTSADVTPLLAVYAGSFDPVTLGHLDLIERASKLFGEVVVAIGRHPTRQPLFTFDERMAMLVDVTRTIPNVRVDAFEGL